MDHLPRMRNDGSAIPFPTTVNLYRYETGEVVIHSHFGRAVIIAIRHDSKKRLTFYTIQLRDNRIVEGVLAEDLKPAEPKA